jgi:hypothetical protein
VKKHGDYYLFYLLERIEFLGKRRRVIYRAANESSRAELGLTQARLMKIRVESSRARETVRAEKPGSNSARYYSS